MSSFLSHRRKAFRGGADPVSNPLHHWDLTTLATGTGCLDQGSGAWGELTQPTNTPDENPSGAPDGTSTCLNFVTRSPSASDYLSSGDKVWDGGTDGFSCSVWVKLDAISTTANYILSWRGTTYTVDPYIFDMRIDNDGADYTAQGLIVEALGGDDSYRQAADTSPSSSPNVGTATWYHMVFTFDTTDNEAKLYIGTTGTAPTLQGTNTASVGTISALETTTAAPFNIGSFVGTGSQGTSHNGDMYCMSIYDYALSTDDISFLWNSGDGRKYSEL